MPDQLTNHEIGEELELLSEALRNSSQTILSASTAHKCGANAPDCINVLSKVHAILFESVKDFDALLCEWSERSHE